MLCILRHKRDFIHKIPQPLSDQNTVPGSQLHFLIIIAVTKRIVILMIDIEILQSKSHSFAFRIAFQNDFGLILISLDTIKILLHFAFKMNSCILIRIMHGQLDKVEGRILRIPECQSSFDNTLNLTFIHYVEFHIKSKAAVEGTVYYSTIAIVGKLRNRKFFSFDELNSAIRKELEKLNSTPFQKREGSRKSVYLEEELPFMQKLPLIPFELSEWKKAKVQLNYHISVAKMNYSVPYEYVGKYVDVKPTNSSVTVFYKSNQICSHKRLYGRVNQYSTEESHMPENHQLFQ